MCAIVVMVALLCFFQSTDLVITKSATSTHPLENISHYKRLAMGGEKAGYHCMLRIFHLLVFLSAAGRKWKTDPLSRLSRNFI